MNEQGFDAIVLGAGGAGLMCAGVAGQRGRRVLVVDHSDKPGKKILISGGGRCNFTNLESLPERYISANRHFAKSALWRYLPQDFIAMVDRHGISWHEKTLGQLFCDGSAKQIVELLVDECPDNFVSFLFGQPIVGVDAADGHFRVTVDGCRYFAPKLVIATGGPAIPKIGATGFAYELAERFGLNIETPRPALVPLTLNKRDNIFSGLAGVAAPVVTRCGPVSFREAALFTHRGLSGPSILQISSYWQQGLALGIDFLPEQSAGWLRDLKRTKPRIHGSVALSEYLPKRLGQVLAQESQMAGELLANLPDKRLAEVEERLRDWVFLPNGTEGFAKAEVTAGGISTAELSSKTMQSKTVHGLYVIGEAVDVTGWLGGYNFQWAWASGWAAGQDL